MTNSDAFPSSGFSGAFDSATWKTIQQFVQQAQHLPTSPNPLIEAILQKIQQAATATNAGPVSDVQLAANGLYNYAQTMVSTLGALGQVAGSGAGAKTAVSQLVGNLLSSLDGPVGHASTTSSGLTTAVNSTTGAAKSLHAEAVKVTAAVGAANDNVAQGSTALKALLTATPLDAAKLDAAMADIRTAAAKMSGQSFVGLSFDPTTGVTALQGAQSQLAAGSSAYSTLKGALGALQSQITATPDDKIADLPQLQAAALARQASDWGSLVKDLHNFTLNFAVVAE